MWLLQSRRVFWSNKLRPFLTADRNSIIAAVVARTEPLNAVDARRLAARVLSSGGTIIASGHAKEQLADRKMSMPDVENVLRCARTQEPPAFIEGSWRYRICTQKMTVVVAFDNLDQDDDTLIEVSIVTGWRNPS